MSEVLAALVKAYQNGDLSFENVALFVTDEFVGLGKGHPSSQHYYMWHKLLKYINIRRENVHILDGSLPSAQERAQECHEFEKAIRDAGGLEIVVTESGVAGDLGRNGPGSSLLGITKERVLDYTASVTIAESLFEGDINAVPHTVLTIGLAAISNAREVLVLFSGLEKAVALENCVEKPINHMWPVSVLQTHKCVLLVCDEPATMELRVRTVKYFEGLQKTANLGKLEASAHLTKQPSKHRLQRLSSSQIPLSLGINE